MLLGLEAPVVFRGLHHLGNASAEVRFPLVGLHGARTCTKQLSSPAVRNSLRAQPLDAVGHEGPQSGVNFTGRRRCHRHAAHGLADQVGISHANAVGDLSPEQKAHHVKMICATGKTLYVGDGINDSLAMKQADTSLSAKTSAELTFQTSQAHLMSPNPLTLLAALDWSKTCRKIVFNNIYASFAYNLTFGAFALLGWINPLGAVVLMPLSSLSLVGMTFYQVHRQGKSA